MLLMAAIAYFILHQIIVSQGLDSLLLKAIGSDWKGKISPILYGLAIGAAAWSQ